MKQTKILDFFANLCERCKKPVYKHELICLKCNQQLRLQMEEEQRRQERIERRKERISGSEAFRIFF